MINICTIELCSSKVRAKNLCNKHYQQQSAVTKRTNKCGCGCEQLTKYTFVAGHHNKVFSSEEGEVTQEILQSLFFINSNTGDFHRLKTTSHNAPKGQITKGTLDGKGYYHICIRGKIYRSHQLVWLYFNGEIPKVIDHINGIRTDNRLCNLRATTFRGNSINSSIGSKNTSGMVGVYFVKSISKWGAQIKNYGDVFWLGSYDNKLDAICARKSAEFKMGFHPNHGKVNATTK